MDMFLIILGIAIITGGFFIKELEWAVVCFFIGTFTMVTGFGLSYNHYKDGLRQEVEKVCGYKPSERLLEEDLRFVLAQCELENKG